MKRSTRIMFVLIAGALVTNLIDRLIGVPTMSVLKSFVHGFSFLSWGLVIARIAWN